MTHLLQYSVFLLLFLLSGCSPNSRDDSSKSPADGPITIYLVRHAEKDLESGNDPPLTPAGIQWAEELARQLSGAGVTGIYSSDTRRTLATAAPLARQLDLDPILYNPKSHPDTLLPFFLEQRGTGNLLIVGHSNTIPATVNAFLGSKQFEDLQDSEYDKLFVVTRQPDGSATIEVRTIE